MQMRFPVIAAFLFFPGFSFSQNLLVNGGFEEENICTEYKVNCSPEAWVTNKDGFSTYFKDSNRAYEGERFLAIEVGHTTKTFQRTFYRTRFLCGLRKDHQYRLNFYIKSPFTVLDSMGVLFTSYDFLLSKTRLQNLSPTFFLKPAAGTFTNDSNWQKITMDYRATGEESFIAIASFARRDMKGGVANSSGGHFFVFIDDISLVPLDPREHLCREAQTNKQDIFDQDERHEFLRQKVRQNNDNPPLVVMPPTVLLKIDTLVLPDVLFASGRADLHKSSYKILDDLSYKLLGKKVDSIVVEGHTDNTGALSANEKLSLNRADAVKEALWQRLNRSRPFIITRGWADKRPVAGNHSASGRQQNRRVELFIYTME